jgi:hypothetical protein
MQDPGLERALVRSLRAEPAACVLHVGAGAGGSPNVAWLADRMGSLAFAVVRSAEIVCQRGDLVDASGAPCGCFDDAARCRRCCTSVWRRRPRADDFRNRWDLLLAGLAVAEAVFADDEAGAERLVGLGVGRRRIVASHCPRRIVPRVLGGSAT